MFAPGLYQQGAQNATLLFVLEGILLGVGIVLTYQAHAPVRSR